MCSTCLHLYLRAEFLNTVPNMLALPFTCKASLCQQANFSWMAAIHRWNRRDEEGTKPRVFRLFLTQPIVCLPPHFHPPIYDCARMFYVNRGCGDGHGKGVGKWIEREKVYSEAAPMREIFLPSAAIIWYSGGMGILSRLHFLHSDIMINQG